MSKEIFSEDGVRRYANSGTRYRPVPIEERKNKILKPSDPRAVRFHQRWFLPLDLLPMAKRTWPETIPDSNSKGHRLKCRCHSCRRPGGPVWKRQQRKLARSASSGQPAPGP